MTLFSLLKNATSNFRNNLNVINDERNHNDLYQAGMFLNLEESFKTVSSDFKQESLSRMTIELPLSVF